MVTTHPLGNTDLQSAKCHLAPCNHKTITLTKLYNNLQRKNVPFSSFNFQIWRYSFNLIIPDRLHQSGPKQKKASASLAVVKNPFGRRSNVSNQFLAASSTGKEQGRGVWVRRRGRNKGERDYARRKRKKVAPGEGGLRGGEKLEDGLGPTWYLRRHFLADCQ